MDLKMMTREIRPETWPTYWQNLSRLYQGWWVTIEELGRELGDQRLADRLPLQGISFDAAGSEAGAILIEAGDAPESFMIHHVLQPRSVWMADTQPGAGADLRIEAHSGEITLVHLRLPLSLPSPRHVAERRRAARFWSEGPIPRASDKLSAGLILGMAALGLAGIGTALFVWSRSKRDDRACSTEQ